MEKEKEDSKSKEKEMEENIGSTKKSSDLETIKEMEVEEGEIEENWQDVTPKKASRSSTLKFGQVKILTPSRFPNLLEVDEKGDVINVVETEEILSVVEEILEEGVDTERVIEENKEKEKEDIDAERKENDCEMQKEGNKFEENQNQGIAGIQISQENWPDLASASKIRPSLPRRSKTSRGGYSSSSGTKCGEDSAESLAIYLKNGKRLLEASKGEIGERERSVLVDLACEMLKSARKINFKEALQMLEHTSFSPNQAKLLSMSTLAQKKLKVRARDVEGEREEEPATFLAKKRRLEDVMSLTRESEDT
ncbi:hypothetical protein HID58_080552 [Brassica napus]|uniref:Uncharacterized protein n=1 Tax=Brassica napus TaxID=3708 RepID=A0ABQ7Y5A1_BRANA|nr:hypothetical protein HID58_080552 [Brassica napus]